MNLRIAIISIFAGLTLVSAYQAFNLKYSFDFEQFFPDGDQDLEFFRDFVEDFETDDNFLLIAVRRDSGVFHHNFLEKFHALSLQSSDWSHVVASQSLTTFTFPQFSMLGLLPTPAINISDPSTYTKSKEQILADERFVHNLINEDATAMVLFVKIVDGIQLNQARELMAEVEATIEPFQFDGYHFLGRPYFQKELVQMQQRELIMSAVVSGTLVLFVMLFIFRKVIGIGIALVSIGMGMLFFLGFMGITGRDMSAMSALYPVLMIIVGTSDVIHIMSKYIDELQKGASKKAAITTTIKEIGLATLLTSITTAIGFASLLSSRIGPIRDFGLNSAIGVIIAYITVVFFTTSLLSYFSADQLIKQSPKNNFWERSMLWSYWFTKEYPVRIAIGGLVTIAICFIGISMITTNYSITHNLPRGKKITSDFRFFEKELTGFRPMEFAIYAQNDYEVDDFEVVNEMERLEQHLRQIPYLQGISSITMVYKSINQAFLGYQKENYKLPEQKEQFIQYQKMAENFPNSNVNVLVSADRKKARITSRIMDAGADTIKNVGKRIDHWVNHNIDTTIIQARRTGTGLIIDKNSEYVRRSIMLGLGGAILIVSLLMVLLFQNLKLLVISLVPNIIPLLIAGALLGYLGVELEAGVSIVFAVIFGIAVDDTIHFLSKFKLAQNKGLSIEESLKITFTETGKAICLTTIILFFGFLIMLFSIHPPSVIVGTLIAATLFSALFGDLLFIPVLIRWLL